MNTVLVRQLLAAFATLLLWAGAAACYTYMPPIAGIPWLLVVLGVFWYRFIRRGSASSRLHVPIAIALPRTPWWVLGTTMGAAVVFYLAFQTYYFRLMPPRPDATTAFDSYTHQPLGWLATFVASVLVLPVMEEVVFRGWVLRSIERRAGTPAALALSAIIFSAFHLELWAASFHFVSGAVFGLVALRTNSVGAAMLVHMVANATEKTMSAIAGPSPALWPDRLGISSVAQPLLAIAAVAALGAALWRLGAGDPSTSPHGTLALGTRS